MANRASRWLLIALSASVLLHRGADAMRANKQVRQEQISLPAATPPSSNVSAVEEFKCKSAGFFGNDADCALFYRCVDYFGTGEHFSLFHFQCAPGTIFDESISVCNHPERVSPRPKCASAADEPAQQGASASQGSASVAEKPIISSAGNSANASQAEAGHSAGVTGEASGGGTTTCVCTTTPASSSVFSTTPSTGDVEPTPTDGTAAPPTTASAAEGTTAPSVGATDASTSEPSTLAPPTQQPSATDVPTTSAPPSGGLPLAPPAELATDEPATTTSSSSSEAAEPSSTVSPIPTPPGVLPGAGSEAFMLVCGDQAFHRHPLDCKLYYQCIWSGFAFTFNLYSCQGDTIYDESSSACTSPETTSPCKHVTMPALPVVNVTALPDEGAASLSTTTSATPQYTLAPGSLYDCPKPGHFAYQLDCIRFYRCFEISPGVLKGLLYRCPPGYAFSKTSERCEEEETLGTCDVSVVRKGSIPVPVIPLEQAILVPAKDFNYFFNNPNFFYFPRQSNRRVLSN